MQAWAAIPLTRRQQIPYFLRLTSPVLCQLLPQTASPAPPDHTMQLIKQVCPRTRCLPRSS